MLVITHVSKSFGAMRAVDDVSLSIDAGEIVALIGENGAGKTTLMRIAAGELAPDAGKIVTQWGAGASPARTGEGAGAPLSIDWNADLDTLQREIPATHPNAFHATTREAFDASIAKLRASAPNLPPNAVVAEIARIVASIGDGHTRLTLPVDPNAGFFSGHTPTKLPDDPALRHERQQGQPDHVIAISNRAQQRLYRVNRRMRSRGKPHNVTVVACAREEEPRHLLPDALRLHQLRARALEHLAAHRRRAAARRSATSSTSPSRASTGSALATTGLSSRPRRSCARAWCPGRSFARPSSTGMSRFF